MIRETDYRVNKERQVQERLSDQIHKFKHEIHQLKSCHTEEVSRARNRLDQLSSAGSPNFKRQDSLDRHDNLTNPSKENLYQIQNSYYGIPSLERPSLKVIKTPMRIPTTESPVRSKKTLQEYLDKAKQAVQDTDERQRSTSQKSNDKSGTLLEYK